MAASLYRDIVGSGAWDALPRALHDLHERGGDGTLVVTSRGIARLFSVLGYAPSPGSRAVTLRIEDREAGGERWVRNFQGEVFATEQRVVHGLITERVGAAVVQYKVTARGVTLQYEIVSLRVLGLTIPPWMRPRIEASERADGPRVHVSVSIGNSFRYAGYLVPR